jgi:hypothetical protein
MKTMDPSQVAMLLCGLTLFLLTVGLLIHASKNAKPIKGIIALLPIAIVMIGFSSISKVVMYGVEIDEKPSQEFNASPNQNVSPYNASLTKLELAKEQNPVFQLSSAERSGLEKTLSVLNEHKDLTPQVQVTKARVELLLGQRTQATATLAGAVKAQPALKNFMTPKLQAILVKGPS